MKIGFALDDTLDSTAGVQQYILSIGMWLREQGHDVYYLVGETYRTDIPGVHSLTRNKRVQFNGNQLSVPLPVRYARLRTLVRQLDLDILHVQVPYSPYMAGRLIRLMPPTTAVVGTFHILPYGVVARIGSGILGKINATTARRFDAMLAVSAPAQVFAAKHYGFRSAIVAIPFSHDMFSVARRGKLAPRRQKRIVFLGRLVARKGAAELLQAVEFMVANALTDVSFRVVIAGSGSGATELQKFVQEHGLTDTVSFSGFVEEVDKPALLASADILAFPSTGGESFGISLLEGMAASRGVVLAGDNPGYRSVAADERQLVNPRDTPAFAQALAYWLSHDAERLELARLQHTHVAQYDIDLIGSKIVAVYNHALKNRRP